MPSRPLSRPTRVAGLTAAIAAASVALAGCAGTGAPTPSAPSASPSATTRPSADPIAGLSLEQRVGELFMVGTPAAAASPVTLDAVTTRHVGGIFLSGRSTAGVEATRDVVGRFTTAVSSTTTGGLPLLVATDQEGGEVQVLRGPGFSTIPSAVQQGAMPAAELETAAAGWGRELAAAGVNMDLAPVADIVESAAAAPANPPVGGLDREFGYDAEHVGASVAAVSAGLRSVGVLSTAKHFPGLGTVTGNTDTTAGVTDPDTDASSPSVQVYTKLIDDGAPAIMVSTAIYTRLDPDAPAAFSPRVVTGLLREHLGFHGLVVTDDLSGATQVAAWSPADRATLAISAGVDQVLVSRTPDVAAQMIDAVLARARSDADFRRQVDAAARRVVAAKARLQG